MGTPSDVTNHALELRLNTNQNQTQQFLRLSKNLDMSGEFQAKNFLRYEVGDIQLQSDELIYRSQAALGVSIFNFDPSYSRTFSQITIEETILPGWRVQLFRNSVFLQETFSNDRNRVIFEQVDTFLGTNLFEIKFYGPEGQEEIRYKTVNVGSEQLTPGKLNYAFNVSDAGKRFIDGDVQETLYDKNISGLLSYGLSKSTTIEGSLHSVSGLDQEQTFASSALYMNFSSVALKTQWVKDVDAGSALFFGLNTSVSRLLRLNFNARYFDDFKSAAYPERRDIRTEVELRLNGQMPWWKGVNWSSNIQSRTFRELDETNQVSLSLSKNLIGGSITSSLVYQDGFSQERWRHRVLWSQRFGGWQIANSLEWLPEDEQEILSYYSTLRWPQSYNTYNQSRIEYRADRDDKVLFTHSFNWHQDRFNFQAGGSVSGDGNWTVDFGISGDIEYDMFAQHFNAYRPRGSVSNIHALAYLDNNRNSIFDVGDDTLSDIGMIGNGKWRELRTDSQGLMQLPTNSQTQRIRIDESSLPDIYMVAVDKLVQVNTHRGGISWVQLPVVTVNDVEGAIYVSNNENSRGLGSFTVQLLDSELKVVAETQTEVDGYFFFTRIPPGQYTLKLDAQYLKKNNLIISNVPKIIDAPLEGDSIRMSDIVLVASSPMPMPELDVGSFKQAPLPVEQNDKVPSTVEDIKKPTLLGEADAKLGTVETDAFYVQLGVFKNPATIAQILKSLPTKEYDFKIFRNNLTGLSYLVMGGFASRLEARPAVDMINKQSQFTRAYVSKGSRYFSSGWSLEPDFSVVEVNKDNGKNEQSVDDNVKSMTLAEHLLLSSQTVGNAPSNSYFCQLASYGSLTSVNTAMLNNNKMVHVVRRQVNNKGFYTLYTGPVTNPLECQNPSVRRLTPNVPFALSIGTLRGQLMANP